MRFSSSLIASSALAFAYAVHPFAALLLHNFFNFGNLLIWFKVSLSSLTLQLVCAAFFAAMTTMMTATAIFITGPANATDAPNKPINADAINAFSCK